MKNLQYLMLIVIAMSIMQTAYSSNEPNKEEAIVLVKHSDQIKIDGILDEPIWSELEPLSMTMYAPVNGDKPSERTEMSAVYASYRDVSGILTPGIAWLVLLAVPVAGVFAAGGLGLFAAWGLSARLHPRLGINREALQVSAAKLQRLLH